MKQIYAQLHDVSASILVRFPWITGISLFLIMAETGLLSAEETKSRSHIADGTDPSGVRNVVSLDVEDLSESSGLAISRVRDGHYWSHNDSGGEARLFAFDRSGDRTGKLELKSVDADDWEDMASYNEDGVARLLVADCGDNQERRKKIRLYLFDEPDPKKSVRIKSFQTLEVTYPDGPVNCEAVAVDMKRREILLTAKSVLPIAGVFKVALPPRQDESKRQKVQARRVLNIPLPMVTAMDINPINGDIWIISYFQAFRFRASRPSATTANQLRTTPTAFELPRWKQIEAVAVDSSGDLWMTSEGSPTPFGRLPQNEDDRSK
ncbi:MAG: hypothetical protein AB8B91_03760 [Rubripirellula sp.]